MQNKSINEVEESVQAALEALPSILRSKPLTPLSQQVFDAVSILFPAGYHPVVELQQEDGRRKRRTASADKNWSPETDKIQISFSKAPPSRRLAVRKEDTARPVQGATGLPVTQTLPVVARRTMPQDAARPAGGGGMRVETAESTESMESDLCSALEEVERQNRAFIALKWFRDDVLPATGFNWVAGPEQRQAVLASAIAKGLIVTSRVPNPRSAFPTTAIRLNRMPVAGQDGGQRYSPVRIQGDPLSSTILRDRGSH